jgi:hypothetical protein
MAEAPIINADYNDFSGIVGPIRGINPGTGVREVYHGSDLTVFIALTNESDAVAVGTLTYTPTEIGATGKYPFGFDGDEIATSLEEVADGTTVYRIVSTPSGIRVWRALTYKKTRESRL